MAKLIPGENDLETTSPGLASEWHPTKNGGLSPKYITATSSTKIWWMGPCGHKWEAKIANRIRGTGCPICAGKKVVVGLNDFATAYPSLSKQWHPTKNGSLTPSEVTAGSNKKVWWLCDKGHEWQATIRNRNKGSGCPYCWGRLVIPGETDLETIKPQLADQWHPTKNGALSPDMVTYASNKKAWWLCPTCGHEWEAVIANRSRLGRGCPVCGQKKALETRKKKSEC